MASNSVSKYSDGTTMALVTIRNTLNTEETEVTLDRLIAYSLPYVLEIVIPGKRLYFYYFSFLKTQHLC